MKYLIASDIHGSEDSVKNLLVRFGEEKADKIILLGDIYYHGPRNPFPDGYNPKGVAQLLNEQKDCLIVVKGNCDSEVDEMISLFKFLPQYIIQINNKKILFIHGHNIKYPLECDIVVFGHEHIGYIKKENEHIFVNSGSISLPKNNSPKSYLVLDENEIFLKDFNGKVLDSIKF